MLKHLTVTASALALLAATSLSAETVDTRIGPLEFTHDFANGYPTTEAQEKLFDEIDFQRACQVYLWALPIVSMEQWRWSHENELGVENGQALYALSYEDKIGGLTYNATTPYVLPFIDLTEEPWIVEVPSAELRGAFNDFWQVGVAKVEGGRKYILVGPDADPDQDDVLEAAYWGFQVVKFNTNNVLPGIRLMADDDETRQAILDNLKIYPFSERKDPKPRGYVPADGKAYSAWQPRGMAYWERLADVINKEPVQERDRFFLAMLKPLGIEKGKPFEPGERQRKILEEAALVGEAMAKANDFNKERLEDAFYVEDSMWEFATVSHPSQRREHHDDLDARAAWFYEAVTNDPRMHAQRYGGEGQIYMATYRDGDGDWLDGGTNYTLNVPPDAPAEAFWSMTVYDVATRALTINNEKLADRSSKMDLLVNDDGSVDLYIGPDKPEGDKAENWIETLPGKAWFPYFRFYSPKDAFIDRTWVLPNIEKAN
ncbi:DUF1214 domain-containing protein [Tropicimonas sediminicola]|uniref:Uncharacterized conserved protein n=1 Tax=Tropicimonas sediminicola TaxID=1031541 RepID=A0A239FXX6_9RHOB|nr:DUF1254 domain-containing protein [Tropicimonas sediminicola]SNS61053.1 Uncharacterized conserved protein [Tropicimonas sediminicola]